MKVKVLLVSLLTIALCISVIAGSTFALFSASDDVNIVVGAANLAVTAEIDETSLNSKSLGGNFISDNAGPVQTFENGGTAFFKTVNENQDNEARVLEIQKMTPGDAVTFTIKVKNDGEVAVAYTVNWTIPTTTSNSEEVNLFEALDVKVESSTTLGGSETGTKQFVDSASGEIYHALGGNNQETTFYVTVTFKADAGDKYQSASSEGLYFTVKTVQVSGIVDGKIVTT